MFNITGRVRCSDKGAKKAVAWPARVTDTHSSNDDPHSSSHGAYCTNYKNDSAYNIVNDSFLTNITYSTDTVYFSDIVFHGRCDNDVCTIVMQSFFFVGFSILQQWNGNCL